MIPLKLAKVQRHRHSRLRDVADHSEESICQNRSVNVVAHAVGV